MRMIRKLRFHGPVIALCLATFLSPAQASAATLSGDLAQILNLKLVLRVNVIVQTNGAPTASLLSLVQLLGGNVYAQFNSINGFAVNSPLSLITTLLSQPSVERICPDRKTGGALDLSSAAVGSTTARNATGLSGAGIGVAVLDTGVDPHADLVTPTNRIIGWTDLVNGKASPYDDSGHGTHVAGIIAGNSTAAAKAGRDLRGMAPGANLIAVKVLDAKMQGSASTVIKGLDYCMGKRQQLGIRIINLSLGQPVQESYQTDPLCRAVEKLWKSGVVVVAAAGNLGRINIQDPNSGVQYGYITCPGNDPLAITVGATRTNYTADRSDDQMATFSSRGPSFGDHILKPDLVAPGNRVLSTIAAGGALATANPSMVQSLGGASYFSLSGTSMASPMVAGAVALLLQAAPSLTPDTVKIRLMHAAIKQWNPAVADNAYSRGAGLLNVPAALQETAQATQWAASPVVARGSTSGQFSLQGSAALYGNQALWSDQALWGDQALWADQALWGDNAVWGDQALWGDNAVWGDQALWADQALWGD